MKKRNNMGFMLTETLIVSTFVTATLIYMFINFRDIYISYNRSFIYNSVNNLYSINEIKKYITDADIDNIINKLQSSNKQYIDISNCSSTFFKEPAYCDRLLKALNVDKVYFANNNMSVLKRELESDVNVPTKVVNFISYMSNNTTDLNYKIIAYFYDETTAALDIKWGD